MQAEPVGRDYIIECGGVRSEFTKEVYASNSRTHDGSLLLLSLTLLVTLLFAAKFTTRRT